MLARLQRFRGDRNLRRRHKESAPCISESLNSEFRVWFEFKADFVESRNSSGVLKLYVVRCSFFVARSPPLVRPLILSRVILTRRVRISVVALHVQRRTSDVQLPYCPAGKSAPSDTPSY